MEAGYKNKAQFWIKDKPKVMGDLIGRPDAIALLGEIKGKSVWEAGSGTGYVARILANMGATVYCSERELSMHQIALEKEAELKHGIAYKLEDMCKTEYPDKFFDRILSVGVLIHSSVAEIDAFIKQAYRTLKDEGRMVISVTHPFMYTAQSPSRKSGLNWVKHEPTLHLPAGESQIFKEQYFDIDGNMFPSYVWYHPKEIYYNSVEENRFSIEYEQELLVKKEHLLSPLWGTEYGYPAFFQMLLKKAQ